MRAFVMVLLVGLVVLAGPAPGLAQSSGGSYGSNGFGGGSSSSGGGSSSSSGGGGGSSSGGSSGGGSSEPWSAATISLPSGEYGERYMNREAGAVVVTRAEHAAADDPRAIPWLLSTCCTFVFFALVFAYATFAFGRSRFEAPTGPYEVRQITVAFDWTARRAMQERLLAMAARFGEGEAGRRDGSAEAVRVLQEACGAARYAAFQTFRGTARDAEARFQSVATSLRARYQHERAGARAIGGGPTAQARAVEGEGLVVVSLVVAWDQHLAPLPSDLSPQAAVAALGTLTPRPGAGVIALEVIWSPADEQDRMSSAELEALYPELQRLDGRADVGRMGCTYCRAVFPRELGACPACGAPADAAPRASA